MPLAALESGFRSPLATAPFGCCESVSAVMLGLGKKTRRNQIQENIRANWGVFCKKGNKSRELTKKIGFYMSTHRHVIRQGGPNHVGPYLGPALEIFVVWVNTLQF